MTAGWYPGRCNECAAAAEPGRSRCAACAKAHNAREAARRAERKAAGKCVVCGVRAARSAGEALTVCPEHRAYYAERRRKAAG